MTKKILFVLAIVLTFTTSLVFAATNDMVSNAGNSVKNVVSDVGSGIKNGAEGIRNGIQDVGNDFSGAMRNDDTDTMMNTDNDMSDRNTTTGGFMSGTNNGDYTATRTAGTTTNNTRATVWTWFILAVAAVLIVGLVWYYGTQTESRKNTNRD